VQPVPAARATEKFSPSLTTASRLVSSVTIRASRGLGIEPVDRLLFVNSGSNRILALDRNGQVVRASRAIEGLNPGGGNFGPDGRYYVGLRGERTIMAFARKLDRAGEYILPPQVVPFPRGFAFALDGTLFLASGIGQAVKATTRFWRSIPIPDAAIMESERSLRLRQATTLS
jgi:sugar lactone lactonase YvrE